MTRSTTQSDAGSAGPGIGDPGKKPASPPPPTAGAVRAATAKALILVTLWAWLFWPELTYIYRRAPGNSDWAHALATPIAIILLIYLRRSQLTEKLTRGSAWGVVLILAGLASYAVTSGPFDYDYVRQLSIVPVLAGIVLTVGGWAVLKRCIPMLLLVLLSIPIGQRIYARMIIKPETYTLSATRVALDQLPGVAVGLDGPDLMFARGQDIQGTVALGEPRRGVTLLLSYAVIGVFVVFARIRPVWQVVIMALAAVPVVLFCNWLRLFTWGIVAIYGGADPVSAVPRAVAAIVSLLAAYVIFALMCAVLGVLVVEGEPGDDDDDIEEPACA